MNFRTTFQRLRITTGADAAVLFALSVSLCFFLVTGNNALVNLSTPFVAGWMIAGVTLTVLAAWAMLLSFVPAHNRLWNARLSLLPLMIPAITIPYHFFYPVSHFSPVFVVLISLAGVCIVPHLLHGRDLFSSANTSVGRIAMAAFLYAAVFGTVAVLRHFAFQDMSSFDTAIYNQIQWNNLHGRFFQSSISGNNFVTHNSPFLILLTPFYALYPHPASLIALKSAFLAASAFPAWLILNRFVHRRAAVPLLIGYLFFPFIVGQHFNAPHEICFILPFTLFAFYFFLTSRFVPFFVFLVFCLSVKEHMALIAVMFGVYAFLIKRSKRWIVVPIVLGIVWALLSLWIIDYFQQMYAVDRQPAWLIENIKRRFLHPDKTIVESLATGVEGSTAGKASSLIFVYPLFAPLFLGLPFGSLVSWLGFPELLINLLASSPMFYPNWHYNIISGTFLFLGAAITIKKISEKLAAVLPSAKTETALSWTLCLCILAHSFLWWGHTQVRPNHAYRAAMREAIDLIPDDTSVSAPETLVSYVSTRRDYFLLSDPRKGEYVLLDQGRTFDAENYELIFEENGVMLYRKVISEPALHP